MIPRPDRLLTRLQCRAARALEVPFIQSQCRLAEQRFGLCENVGCMFVGIGFARGADRLPRVGHLLNGRRGRTTGEEQREDQQMQGQ